MSMLIPVILSCHSNSRILLNFLQIYDLQETATEYGEDSLRNFYRKRNFPIILPHYTNLSYFSQRLLLKNFQILSSSLISPNFKKKYYH